MEATVVENVPQYAVSYLIYGETDDLLPEDLEAVRAWHNGLLAQGIMLGAPIEGSENEFCAKPAFGLACETVDFDALIKE